MLIDGKDRTTLINHLSAFYSLDTVFSLNRFTLGWKLDNPLKLPRHTSARCP